MKLGSLCTGYGGLDLAVDALLGTEAVWLSEIDKNAAKVCEARFPGVPNLGDLTAIDWFQVEPVDVLTAGYPCQPFSHAGKRQGTNDDRHIWPFILDALRVLRPRLALFENVAGHASLGFDVVLADLAAIGFDVEWTTVRASDVGACHRRARLFILATDSQAERRGSRGRPGTMEGQQVDERPPVEPRRRCDALPPDAGRAGTRRDARAVPRSAEEGGRPGVDVRTAVDAGAATPDPHGRRLEVRDEQDGRTVEPGLEAPRRHDPDGLGATADPDLEGLEGREPAGRRELPAGSDSWGDYWPTIERHGRLVGRPAPAPTDAQGRLSAPFVEWMMCLPLGWVTDVLPRNPALKALGNGVVPPQAAYAISHLLERHEAAERAA